LLTDLNAINTSQQQVENDEVGLFLAGQAQSGMPIGGDQHPKSFTPQAGLKFFKGLGILVHQQNAL
jgi:hypothetical protein